MHCGQKRGLEGRVLPAKGVAKEEGRLLPGMGVTEVEGKLLPGESITEEEEDRCKERASLGRRNEDHCQERASLRRRKKDHWMPGKGVTKEEEEEGRPLQERLSLSGPKNCGWVFSPKTDEAKRWISSHIARPTSLLLLRQISISPPFVFCHTQACLFPLKKVSVLPRQKSNKYWVQVCDSLLTHTIMQSAPGHIVHSCNPQQAYLPHPLQL